MKGSHDLSRRVKLHHLHGLSFREYLNFYADKKLEPILFENLITSPINLMIYLLILNNAKGIFSNYLQQGYYPFYTGDPGCYYERISRMIEKSVYEDIAPFYKLKTKNLIYFKKILLFVTTIPPGKVNTHNLANNVGIDYKTTNHYLQILNEIGLIRILLPKKAATHC